MTRKPPGASIGKPRSGDTTMRLLRQAGLEMFSRHGFDGASTKMVAEHARINEAWISRSFGGKDGLLNAIIGEFARGLHDDSAAYAAGRTVEEELANFLTGTIGAATRNATFLKLVLTRALLYPEFRKTITRELQGAGEARLLGRLRLFQARQVISSTTDLRGHHRGSATLHRRHSSPPACVVISTRRYQTHDCLDIESRCVNADVQPGRPRVFGQGTSYGATST